MAPDSPTIVRDKVEPPGAIRAKGEGDRAGQRECCWQRERLPEAIRDLVLDDQRLRNGICWSVFDC